MLFKVHSPSTMPFFCKNNNAQPKTQKQLGMWLLDNIIRVTTSLHSSFISHSKKAIRVKRNYSQLFVTQIAVGL